MPQTTPLPVRRILISVLCAALPVLAAAPAGAADPRAGINMLDYWPALNGSTKFVKHISTDFYGRPFEGMRSIYARQSKDAFTKTDFIFKSKGRYAYNDTWFLRRQNGLLIEYRDDLKIGSSVKPIRVVFRKGREISWGGAYDATPPGNTTVRNTAVDTAKSDPYFSRSKASQFGYVLNRFETVLPTFTAGPHTYQNVAVIYHYQTMCLDQACDVRSPVYNARGTQTGGAMVWEIRFWLAPGKGIVQTQYLHTSNVKGDPTKGRIDYVSKMCDVTSSQKWCTSD